MTAQVYVRAASPFEAAREVAVLPENHQSRRLHGHSFVAKIRIKHDGSSWARFPGDEPNFLKRRLDRCVHALDYRYRMR